MLLHALGTPDEAIVHTTWAEMDRTIEADHLTSLYIPSLTTPVGGGYVRFHQLARTLREQCPWDIEQTHQSLLPYLIEETYEVVDAIQDLDADDPATDEALIEELGDLLYQIEFHATIAEQEGRFTIADVTRGVHDKLVRRHPHVFGDADGNVVDVDGAGEVLSNWETIKRAEKARTSVFDGVPTALPGLAYADTIQSKAAKVGFDWPDVSGALPKIVEEAGELADASDRGLRQRGDRRRARRPAVRGRQRRPSPRRRPRGRAAGGDAQVPVAGRAGRATRHRARHRHAHRRPRHPRRDVERGQAASGT